MPKIHLHIDLESVREAEGVTNRQNETITVKDSNFLSLTATGQGSPIPQTKPNDMFDAVHLARLLKMSASIMGRKYLGSISVTDYNPIIED